MKIVALTAAAALSLTPALAMAQASCPPGFNAVGSGDTLVCTPPDGNVFTPGTAEGTVVDQFGNVYQVEGGQLVGADATVYVVQPDGTLVVSVTEVPAGGVAGGPLAAFGGIPPGALAVGGLVLLSGLIIGIVAAQDDDGAVVTTPSTPSTPGT